MAHFTMDSFVVIAVGDVVWLGGRVFDATGSYDAVWWLTVALGLVAAVLHLPIDDRPLARLSRAGTVAAEQGAGR